MMMKNSVTVRTMVAVPSSRPSTAARAIVATSRKRAVASNTQEKTNRNRDS